MDFKGKRVLVFAPTYFSLYKEVLEALKSMGAQVGFIPDSVQRFNPYYKTERCLTRILKKILFRIINPNKKYLEKYNALIDQKWDIFLCIDGYSFDYSFFDGLKKQNPSIKTILYLWDDLGYYDYSYSFPFFESIFTFDYRDSNKYNLSYLPLFWTEKPIHKSKEVKYDVSFVGSLHSDRFDILNKIIAQCKKEGITYYIKLVVIKRELSWSNKIKFLILKNKKDIKSHIYCQEFEILSGEISNEMLTFKPIPSDVINEILNKSRCVIDIVKVGQNGLSNRAIAALSSRKKILSTNLDESDNYKNLYHNIMPLDRNNPILDIDFIKSPFKTTEAFEEEIKSLEINNWLKRLIN